MQVEVGSQLKLFSRGKPTLQFFGAWSQGAIFSLFLAWLIKIYKAGGKQQMVNFKIFSCWNY